MKTRKNNWLKVKTPERGCVLRTGNPRNRPGMLKVSESGNPAGLLPNACRLTAANQLTKKSFCCWKNAFKYETNPTCNQ